MTKWNYEKLDKMTKERAEFSSIHLNYRYIADNFEEIAIATYSRGDVIPLEFNDIKTAYDGDPLDDIILPEISEQLLDKFNNLENIRHVMHIKHFARSINLATWIDFIDGEVKTFVKNYPQFSKVIIE
ncbi:hypothetical protein [Methanosphaera sp. WGK6]|uniref:hypothetical protein n=1 Tax=Methanosphaera sp. WGK6 TaxID=1561964 RepID=UPI00084CE34A|nr:hypothetical protein [Methanosphaera sp. WGK6]OED29718.1 hypothetical protein NL43_06505 [Methanosphaera sp. WGK6]